MKVAEAIAQALVLEGVRLAAGITGQSIGHVADALAERTKSRSSTFVRSGSRSNRGRICARERRAGRRFRGRRSRRSECDGRLGQFVGRFRAGSLHRRAQRSARTADRRQQGNSVPRSLRARDEMVRRHREARTGRRHYSPRLHASDHRSTGPSRDRHALRCFLDAA